jgi:CheY-like chemotaxis protein
MAKILIVDDEKIIANTMQRVLVRAEHVVSTANNGLEAIALLDQNRDSPFDLVFMDLLMPEIGGSEVLDIIKKKWPSTKVLMMTAYGDLSAREDLLRRGAARVLSKPFDDMTKIPALAADILGQN